MKSTYYDLYKRLNMLTMREHRLLNEDKELFDDSVKKQIKERDEQYTELLRHFVSITKVRNQLKEIFKWIFFVMLLVIIASVVYFCCSLMSLFMAKADIDQLIKAIPLFITAVASFVSIVITIPVIIVKYLFSTKEDENITNIIIHTQDHDTSGRKWTSDSSNGNKELKYNFTNIDTDDK